MIPAEVDLSHVAETLRPKPDTIHVEPTSEELTWLATYSTPGRRGLTDCCWVADPCPYHEAIEVGRCPVPHVPHLALVQHWTGAAASFH